MSLHAEYYIMCRCMSAVHKFTDPASAAASEVSQAFHRLLLGAGPGLPLKAAAQQPPGWLGGKTGQDRLKIALSALKETANAQGKYLNQIVQEALEPHAVKECSCCCHGNLTAHTCIPTNFSTVHHGSNVIDKCTGITDHMHQIAFRLFSML